jgi:CheY-like chemotaxis protein
VESRKHSLSISLPPHPIWIEADPLRLEQVLINLLNNSVKYTDPGGRIELICTTEGERVCMTVRDTGIGIAPHMLQKIFEPFLQLSDTRGSGGLGIGLSLTKKLVELHSGEIEAKSGGPGKGSEFTVRLPLPPLVQLQIPTGKRAAPGTLAKAAISPTIEEKRHRVLVVDDNEAAAKGLSKLLTHKGYEVRVAYDGPGAVEAALRYKPHTIVLDIGLPGFDGYEAARRILAHGKTCTLIALTGFGQEHDKQRAFEAGFDYHLTKPVNVADIEALAPLSLPLPQTLPHPA